MKTFSLGGVHPPENKMASKAAIEVLPLPKRVLIPTHQSLSPPSIPVVKKGDLVKVGTLIARGEGFFSSNIHSSVSGKVFKIDNVIVASGYRKSCVIIDVDGDEWESTIDNSPDIKKQISLSKEEIIAKTNEMGIVGLGGATFPSHVKLSPRDKIEYLIINGVECEPYLTADHRVMLEKAEECCIGIQILMKALDVKKALVGIENNKPDAVAHMQEVASKFDGIEVFPLKVKYPQGAEKQLIKALIGREVPSGQLPSTVGCVVNNIGTAFAVYEAIQKNKPLFERVVTVTGKKVSKPSNLLVRVGTQTKELIDFAGGLPDDTGKIINGGPMMGAAITSIDAPIAKGSSGILMMTKKEAKRMKSAPCIRCAKCVSACPMGLEPYLLSILSVQERFEDVENENVLDCIECGSCQYTCPSGQQLLDNVRVGKDKVRILMRERSKK